MIKRTGSVAEVRQQVKEWKKQGLTVGLVPTMGYLHEGHKSLIEQNKKMPIFFLSPLFLVLVRSRGMVAFFLFSCLLCGVARCIVCRFLPPLKG